MASLEGWSSTIELHPPASAACRSAAPPSRPLPRRDNIARGAGGGGRIRTYVDIRRQIYSLLPLTTRPPLRDCEPPPPGGRGSRVIRASPWFVNTLRPHLRTAKSTPPGTPAGAPAKGAPPRPAARARRAAPAAPATAAPASAATTWLYGRHAVAAALANPQRRWRRLAVLAGQESEAAALVAAARAERRGPRAAPAERGGPGARPGRRSTCCCPTARCIRAGRSRSSRSTRPISTMCCAPPSRRSGRSIVVVLDQVTDPHNVGAVLRSAAAFGAAAVIIAEHGAPPVAGALAKAASGALDCVPLVRVVNLARALDRLKEAGFWCCGLDESAPAPLAALDLGPRVALVLGSEGGGLRRLVRERCDYLARLPTRPALPSLNVSNAAAIALYELVRGRRAGSLTSRACSGPGALLRCADWTHRRRSPCQTT